MKNKNITLYTVSRLLLIAIAFAAVGVAFAKDTISESEAALRELLRNDPNREDMLNRYADTVMARAGDEAMYIALQELAQIKGSWRPKLWLARRALENRQADVAVKYYRDILELAADDTRTLMIIASDLGAGGYSREIIDLIAPVYLPEKHGPMPGMNLVTVYLHLGNYDAGTALMKKLRAQRWPDLREHLDALERQLEQLKLSIAIAANDRPQVSNQGIPGAIWTRGVGNPTWIYLKKSVDAKKVVLMPLAVIRKKNPADAVQRDDDLGRYSRAIALYLTESVFFWSGHDASTIIPISSQGAVIYSTEYADDALFAMKTYGDYVVTGSITEEAGGNVIAIKIADCKAGKIIAVARQKTAADKIGETVLRMEKDVLAALGVKPAKAGSSHYARPHKSEINLYLMALNQSLLMTLAANGIVNSGSLWGEKSMLDEQLRLASTAPFSLNKALLFYSSLRNNKAYQSNLYMSYRQQAFDLQQSLPNKLLNPLLLDIYDLQSDLSLAAQKDASEDERYDQWVSGLIGR